LVEPLPVGQQAVELLAQLSRPRRSLARIRDQMLQLAL
jgi:hypothetical protein